VLPETAAQNEGQCIPCRRGFRKKIEEGKKGRIAEPALQQSLEWQYWVSLLDRYHSGGVGVLKHEERSYLAVMQLVNEVLRGGMDAFFFNSSGALYDDALVGLEDVGAGEVRQALERAKQLLFGAADVPLDTTDRRQHLQAAQVDTTQLNGVMTAAAEHVADRARKFAVLAGLFQDD
jgi:hypothetical protein